MTPRLTLNGAPAGAIDLSSAIANNYGHFTALRVAHGAVRGLDLHLQRLVDGTRRLFGSELDPATVRGWLRAAVAGAEAELAVRITVFARGFDRARPGAPARPDVLIAAVPGAPRTPAAPLRLKSVVYARELPQVKHVGTFPLFHQRAEAQRAGADDALFVTAQGFVAEASIWNIGFWDGARVTWPDAPQLVGTGMQLIRRGLAELGVENRVASVAPGEFARYRAAFLTNASVPVQPVAAIDGHVFAADAGLEALLARAFARNAPQPI